MNKRALFLGLDLGTSGVKVGAIDAEGQLLARAEAQYRTESPQPGWVEQTPEEWWAACAGAIKEVVLQVDRALVQGVCVAGQSPALVCLDDRGEPVRPASIWSDQRAIREADEVAQRLGPLAPFSLLPRLLWLKRLEPTHYLRTKWVCESFDYISFKLTHQVASISPAGLRPWDPRDIAAIGLEPDKFPTRVCQLGEVFGSLAPEVAATLGLPAEVPVIAGTIDAFAAWIGTATLSTGSLCNTAGTSEGVALVWHQPLTDPQQRVLSIRHITGRDWIVGGAMSTGGIMLDWFGRVFYDRVTNPYVALAEEAKSVPAGAEGLIVLPYLVGERAPMFDPHVRGVFFGITGTHTRAHFARAVLESVAFAVKDVCEVIQEMGAEIGEVRVAGGGARNDVWNQIKADVLGRRVLVPEIADSGLLGAAIIAGWGTGWFANLADAAQAMVKFRAVLEPNPKNQEAYAALFELYRSLYTHLKDDFAALIELKKTCSAHHQHTH